MAKRQILLLLIFHTAWDPAVSTQFKMLRGSTSSNYTAEDVQREEDLEFPGKNQRILRIVKENWKNYYDCLMRKENEDKKPEIRRLQEGQYTEFECDFCPKPFQDYEEFEWKYKSLSPDSDTRDFEYLDLTSEMSLTPNKTLQIFNAAESLEGLYVCYHKNDVTSVYVLEVSKNDTIEKVETMRIQGEDFLKLNQNDFEISYLWTQWTECSACGRVGKKFKYGTCYLRSKQGSSKITPLQDKVTESNNGTRNKRRKERFEKSVTLNDSADSGKTHHHKYLHKDFFKALKNKIKNINSTSNDTDNHAWGPELIDKFSTGVPCASQYSPSSAADVTDKLKAVKVMVKYCSEPCPGDQIFEVFDDSGNLIEWANNSAGVYSVFQKIPRLLPDIERRSVAAEFGSDIIIQCPGTSLRNIPVTWKVNKKIIFPDIIPNESNGRFTIDLLNRIHLKRLRLKDSQIFSCWQRDTLVGTVHLNVDKKLKIGFDHHVTLLGILAIVGTFLYVGSKILTREMRKRKKQ